MDPGPNLPYPYSSGVKNSRHTERLHEQGHRPPAPVADDLYDVHLDELRQEGLIE